MFVNCRSRLDMEGQRVENPGQHTRRRPFSASSGVYRPSRHRRDASTSTFRRMTGIVTAHFCCRGGAIGQKGRVEKMTRQTGLELSSFRYRRFRSGLGYRLPIRGRRIFRRGSRGRWFQMVTHRETKESQVFELVQAKADTNEEIRRGSRLSGERRGKLRQDDRITTAGPEKGWRSASGQHSASAIAILLGAPRGNRRLSRRIQPTDR